jgi:hypothetical protein
VAETPPPSSTSTDSCGDLGVGGSGTTTGTEDGPFPVRCAFAVSGVTEAVIVSTGHAWANGDMGCEGYAADGDQHDFYGWAGAFHGPGTYPSAAGLDWTPCPAGSTCASTESFRAAAPQCVFDLTEAPVSATVDGHDTIGKQVEGTFHCDLADPTDPTRTLTVSCGSLSGVVGPWPS